MNLEDEILDLFQTWNTALKTGKPANVLKLYAPTAVLLPTLLDQVRNSPAEIREDFKSFLKKEAERQDRLRARAPVRRHRDQLRRVHVHVQGERAEEGPGPVHVRVPVDGRRMADHRAPLVGDVGAVRALVQIG